MDDNVREIERHLRRLQITVEQLEIENSRLRSLTGMEMMSSEYIEKPGSGCEVKTDLVTKKTRSAELCYHVFGEDPELSLLRNDGSGDDVFWRPVHGLTPSPVLEKLPPLRSPVPTGNSLPRVQQVRGTGKDSRGGGTKAPRPGQYWVDLCRPISRKEIMEEGLRNGMSEKEIELLLTNRGKNNQELLTE